MNAEIIVVIIVVVALPLVALGYFLFNQGARTRRRIRKAQPRPIAELGPPGSLVCVEGVVVCTAPLTTPSGAHSAAFRCDIARPIPRPGAEGAGPRWAQVAFASNSVAFSIEDGTGSLAVVVSTQNDEIEIPLVGRVCLPAALTPAERELLLAGEAAAQGDIQLKVIAASDELRVRERRINVGDRVKIIGELGRGASGALEIAGGKEPLIVGLSAP